MPGHRRASDDPQGAAPVQPVTFRFADRISQVEDVVLPGRLLEDVVHERGVRCGDSCRWLGLDLPCSG